MKLIGILLIVFGVLALAMGGIQYTTREKYSISGRLKRPPKSTRRFHYRRSSGSPRSLVGSRWCSLGPRPAPERLQSDPDVSA